MITRRASLGKVFGLLLSNGFPSIDRTLLYNFMDDIHPIYLSKLMSPSS